ncbi:MAG: membrane protein insertase YidC, partial [Planctomycetes bacterium]|nr:membrane protein insertase YidC [Planctomycetota bacterium]
YFTYLLIPEVVNQATHGLIIRTQDSEATTKLQSLDKTESLAYQFYVGPIKKDILNNEEGLFSPLFNYTGFDVIIHFLLWLLDLYNGIPGVNMGLAIILLTLTVKACLFPLNLKAQTSMFMMSKLGPEIKAMQEKFKNDRQQQGIEQMKLFRENGVNPLAGCLPMFIQMPVFISLFSTIGEGFSLRHAPFIGWIQDLSAPDKFIHFDIHIPIIGTEEGTYLNLLVLLYVVTMFIQQSMMPKNSDPQQQQMQKMMKFMMFGFAIILYNYSSGLMLYFVGSNILGMSESWYIKNRIIPNLEKKKKAKK